jgi:hypothetical protein
MQERIALAAFATLAFVSSAAADVSPLKNVLVITVDDLRPWFPPFSTRYGVRAPNLEACARFERTSWHTHGRRTAYISTERGTSTPIRGARGRRAALSARVRAAGATRLPPSRHHGYFFRGIEGGDYDTILMANASVVSAGRLLALAQLVHVGPAPRHDASVELSD